MKTFAKLSPTLVVKVLKAAFDLKNNDQVARHAHIHGINFIRDYFEIRFLNALSIENFHTTASYAWECSRESLQKACAQFLNDNRDKLTTENTFLDLPAETVRAVLKFSAKEKLDLESAKPSSQVPKKAKSLSNLNF
uniref:BACK domain-containing protein n=1 Tax=Panagrellus redivivus TaxID=6233 RepID=A0A7E4W4F3_PANRE